MTKDLTDLLDFVSLTHDIRNVKRAMWVHGEEQFENDSEHSYQLAICALHIIETRKLALDPFRAMGLALVHDIVEVYAGDTPTYALQEVLATQQDREMEARNALKRKWPHFALLHELIDEYETMKTPESKFIFALDKLLPILNNYLDNGRNWRAHTISLEQVIAAKTKKISVDPTITQYYKEIIVSLKKKPEFFGA